MSTPSIQSNPRQARVTPQRSSVEKPPPPRRDIAAEITAKILTDLAQGVLPWRKPWDCARVAPPGLPLRSGGEPYRGVNVVLLWSAAHAVAS